MKISLKKLTTLVLTTMFVFTLSACSDNRGDDPGDEFDRVVEEAGNVIDDAGNAIEDACEDVKETANAKDKDC